MLRICSCWAVANFSGFHSDPMKMLIYSHLQGNVNFIIIKVYFSFLYWPDLDFGNIRLIALNRNDPCSQTELKTGKIPVSNTVYWSPFPWWDWPIFYNTKLIGERKAGSVGYTICGFPGGDRKRNLARTNQGGFSASALTGCIFWARAGLPEVTKLLLIPEKY